MLLFAQILRLDASLRLASLATIASLLNTVSAQTYTSCNPTEGTCSADTALGTSKNYDFTNGASSDFTATGSPSYGSNGVSFTVAKSGDAPTISSKWYIMFGSYTVTMKAAPGTGIVSSIVLQSDDLDEIDWEFLGSRPDEVQSNYFGQGKTDTDDRSAVLPVTGTQDEFHKYTVQWTSTEIVWQIDGKTMRTLQSNAANGEYPQTPMQLKIGAWAGGDSSNAAGTIAWAGGQTDFSSGPYTMLVSSVSVQDFSTGSSYSYDGTSGTWESIKSNGGSINSSGGSSSVDTASPAVTSTSSGDVPFEGTHRSAGSTSTPNAGGWSLSTMQTSTTSATSLPGLPSGWSLSTSGKVVPASSAAPVSTHPFDFFSFSPKNGPTTVHRAYTDVASSQPQYPTPSSASSSSQPVSAACSSGPEPLSASLTTLRTYDQQGFLTTLVVPVGASRYDDRGSLVTAAPACTTTATASTTVVGSGNEIGLQKKAASVTSSLASPTGATLASSTAEVSGAAADYGVCLDLVSMVLAAGFAVLGAWV